MYSFYRVGLKRRRRSGSGDGANAPSAAHVRQQVRNALNGGIQAKLTVGAPNDVYEQEADHMAERVMNMQDGAVNAVPFGGQLQRMSGGREKEQDPGEMMHLQRQPAEEEEEEEIQTKLKDSQLQRQPAEEEEEEEIQTKLKDSHLQRQPEAEEEEEVQAKTIGEGRAVVSNAVTKGIVSRRSSGEPLSSQTRAFFEPRFGQEFARVRVHRDSVDNQLAESVGARAFTLGRDIFFGQGEYAPDAPSGKRLLAHELTHVLQQSHATGKSAASVQRKVKVDPGVKLDTMGYTTTKSGDTYTCPKVVKKSIWNEIFTALLNSPRVFKLKGSTAIAANKSFREHMAARRNIASFASKKKYAFNVSEKRNPTYWKTGGPTGWELTTPPSGTSLKEWSKKAHADININPDKYEMACNQATRVTMEGGAGAPFNTNTAGSDSDWIPGDAGYITNTGYVSGVSPAGTEGENIIYTGKDKFWGHLEKANTYRTLQEWFDVVKSWDGSANKESHRLYPSNGIE
jgi:hypothetical protein